MPSFDRRFLAPSPVDMHATQEIPVARAPLVTSLSGAPVHDFNPDEVVLVNVAEVRRQLGYSR